MSAGARFGRAAGSAGAPSEGPEEAAERVAGPRERACEPIGGRGRPLRRLWRIARPSRPRLAAAVALATGALCSSVGLLAVSALLISWASLRPPILTLQVAIVTVRALGISRGVLRYGERLVAHDAALRGLTNIRLAVYDRLERLAPAGLGRHRRGDLLARLVADVDSGVDLTVRVVVPGLSVVLSGVAAALIGWALVPAAGLVLLAQLLVAGLVAPALTDRLGSRAHAARAHADGALSAELVSSLAAAPELRVHGAVDAALERIAAADAHITALDRRAATAGGAGEGLAALTTGLCLVANLAVGAAAVAAGELSGVWLATLVLLPLAMADVLSGMPAAALARARVAGAADRIFEVVDAPDPVPGRPGASGTVARTQVAGGLSAPAPRPHAELVGMSARYPGSVGDAVSSIDLDLAQARRIALVGASGSGKSTTVAVLLRLLEHRAGRYELDGTDVRSLTEEAVRDLVTAVDQQTHLFDTTIEENLRLASRDATDAQVAAALSAAELTDWVASLPQGLATRVGSQGSRVSGGEAQRIALARVLLADRPIILLDEPGEHLDAGMADRVTSAAMDATAGRAVLLVTHRMAHTDACDEVIVLSAGRVVERGAPEDLRGWFADARARDLGAPMPTALGAGASTAVAQTRQDGPEW